MFIYSFNSNHNIPYKMCMRCFHYVQGNKLARWDSGFNTLGPKGVRQLEVIHTWWLCEECYNHQLTEVEKRIAKEQENNG